MGLVRYPVMKDSGVVWLGKIPAHWKIDRFKNLLAERDARSASGIEDLLRVSQYTGITKRKPRDAGHQHTRAESLVGYKRVDPGDLVINIMLAWNGSLGVSPSEGIVSPAYCVYRFDGHSEPRYYHYLLRSPVYGARIKAVSRGVVESRLRLYTDDLCRLRAVSPPLCEQFAIVRFLDHADRHIRRYIRAKERLIELLEEQRRAIVHQAVTAQIDVRTDQPYPAYKDSGVEWLGEVPEHWCERPLKRVARIDNSGSYGEEPAGSDCVLPVATTAQIDRDGQFSVGDMPQRGFSVKDVERYRCEVGDILVVKSSGSIFNVVSGKAGIVDESCPEFAFSNFLLRVVADRRAIAPRLLFALLGGWLTRERVKRMVTGSTYPNLRVGEYVSALLPIPPRAEQSAIIRFLDHATNQAGAAISKTRQEIDLLLEYRTRLIADVVTGKLDVREAAGALPGIDAPVAEDTPAGRNGA